MLGGIPYFGVAQRAGIPLDSDEPLPVSEICMAVLGLILAKRDNVVSLPVSLRTGCLVFALGQANLIISFSHPFHVIFHSLVLHALKK